MTGAKASSPTASATDEAMSHESIVVPGWESLFSRLTLEHVPSDFDGTVLDAGCTTGHLALELVRNLAPSSRVVAIDPDPALVELARRRSLDLVGRKLFFKVESAEQLSFGSEVFDLVVANLLLPRLDRPAEALGELRRVLVPGGRLVLSRPLRGTFEEVVDMFREAAVRLDDEALGRRAEALAARDPEPAELAAALRVAGLEDVEVRQEVIRLSFRRPAEVLTDPLLQRIALPSWRDVAGPHPERILADVERSLEIYFAGGPLSLRVVVGVGIGHAPNTAPTL